MLQLRLHALFHINQHKLRNRMKSPKHHEPWSLFPSIGKRPIIITLLLIGAIAWLTPPERWAWAAVKFARATGEPAQLCMDHVSTMLKSPDTAHLNSSERVNDSQVKIIYSAQNGFGAMIKGTYTCAVFNGKVDVKLTELLHENEAMAESTTRLEKGNECLRKRVELMQNGTSYKEAKAQLACESLD